MLDVRDIDVFYGLVPALHQVRLEVAAGETVCLLGPNGAGKTTTVKSIIGILRPRLLILDEPSLGLSPLLVQELFRVLGTLNPQGMSILIVEQNVVQALRISQRAYVLESGKIVLHGPSEELRSSDTIRKSYLGL